MRSAPVTTYDLTLRHGFDRGIQEFILGQITIDKYGCGMLDGYL